MYQEQDVKNIKPKERNERVFNSLNLNKIAYKSKDNVEKAYLSDRVVAFNKPSEKAKINEPDPLSSIFVPESDRFNKDFASYEYERRLNESEKKRQKYENFKNVLFERERKRWEQMDLDYARTENKMFINKEKILVGKKNHPG